MTLKAIASQGHEDVCVFQTDNAPLTNLIDNTLGGF